MLPLFPLRMVVFPEETVKLHIFEPRYRQLIGECEKTGMTFGIPAYLNDQVMDLGTEIQLVSVEKRFPNGELDISTRALGLFRIERFFRKLPSRLYAGGEIRRVENEMDGDLLVAKLLLDKLMELFQRLQVKKALPQDPADFHTYDIAHQVGFSLEQEYDFLCILDETGRQQYLLEHLERLLPTVAEMDEIRRKAQMNGHFKNAIPPTT